VNWLKKAKDAFARLKGRAVKHAEVKEWGINIVNKLFKAIGIDKRVGCPPRELKVIEQYWDDIRVEFRIRFCTEEDLNKMKLAVDILAREAMELTPRDTGLLQSSQYSRVEMEGSDTVLGVVGYNISEVFRVTGGGKTTYYALPVHNRYAYHGQDEYPNNPPRATWRFLEFAWQNKYIQGRIKGLFE
jgi:hypothetical protein